MGAVEGSDQATAKARWVNPCQKSIKVVEVDHHTYAVYFQVNILRVPNALAASEDGRLQRRKS